MRSESVSISAQSTSAKVKFIDGKLKLPTLSLLLAAMLMLLGLDLLIHHFIVFPD